MRQRNRMFRRRRLRRCRRLLRSQTQDDRREDAEAAERDSESDPSPFPTTSAAFACSANSAVASGSRQGVGLLSSDEHAIALPLNPLALEIVWILILTGVYSNRLWEGARGGIWGAYRSVSA
jgi:hypothetical protein